MAKKQQNKPKAAKAATKSSKQKKSAAAKIAKAMPSMPSAPNFEVPKTVKDVGSYLTSVLDTEAGRFVMAELLMQVAKALTTKLAHTETAQNAGRAVANAGTAATIAVADAGNAVVDAGADLATTAKDVAKEVATAAVGAVGGAAVQAAQRMIGGDKRRGKAASREDGVSGIASTPPPRTDFGGAVSRPAGASARPGGLSGGKPNRR